MIVAHYVTPTISADIVAEVDPATAAVRELARFPCTHWPVCSTEHHGGNPIIAPDDSIFVPIGDFFLPFFYAQDPTQPAGKVHQIQRDGRVTMYALGFRNPFDVAIDPASSLLIVPDNGATGEDEINVVRRGDNGGWPLTMGSEPPRPGMLAPAYVFRETVAPTGIAAVRGIGGYSSGGFLLTGYVTETLYYIPDVAISPLPDPIPVADAEDLAQPLLDVVQARSGTIYVATSDAVYRLVLPAPGDANGDAQITRADLSALDAELAAGEGGKTIEVQKGKVSVSWGADANADGVVDSRDRSALLAKLMSRRRAVRH